MSCLRSALACAALALLALCLAAPTAHARNSFLRAHWVHAPAPVDPDTTMHRLNLALVQRNQAELRAVVERVSDPRHASYGQYLSLDEVASLVAPSDEDLARLESLLREAGAVEVDVTASRDFASVLLPVSAIQQLFTHADGSTLHMYAHKHTQSGRTLLRTRHGAAFKPRPDLAPFVDVVSGLADFIDYPHERKAAKRAAAAAVRQRAFRAKNAAAAAAAVAGRSALRRSKRQPKNLMMPLMSSHEQSCVSSAPDFGRLKNSHEDVTVNVIIYCKNGEATTDPIHPCSDFPPAVSALTLTLTPRAHPVQKLTLRVGDAGLSCWLSAADQSVHCLFPTQDFPAWSRMQVQAQVAYADGSLSLPASYGSGTGLAPSSFITPSAIMERYGVPGGTRGSGKSLGNSQAVVAFEEQFIDVEGDMRRFNRDMGIAFQPPSIDGVNDATNPGGESTLDIQYITAIGQNIPTTFMSLTGKGPAKPPGDGAYILEWALHVSNMTRAPLVTSISYGDTESGFYTKFGSYSYIDRMEIELAKMAARGLTVLAGSGDAGVSNVGEEGNDISDTDPTCAPFRAFYPSNSPYVTSVSSTFLSTDFLPVCQTDLPLAAPASRMPVVCRQLGEIAVGVSQGMSWTTGGGFSNRSSNPTPVWQADAVKEYLSTADLPPSSLFNSGGRGYPDVSTLGHNLLMQFGGALTTVDGTSASGPVMAGLVSLLNDKRLRRGQKPLGLLNPLLYQAKAAESAAFVDVVVGENKDGDVQPKCSAYPSTCPDGFKTSPGWNPVTGLGTPNWAVLRDYVLAVGSKDYKRTLFH